MEKPDANEAGPLIIRLTKNLAGTIAPTSGDTGAYARAALGNLVANVYELLSEDAAGPQLVNCFDLVRQAGATQAQMEQVRILTQVEQPKTLGATMIQNAAIALCLVTECQIIAAMTFVSREDIDALKVTLFKPFADAEEIAADDMDQATYRALIELHAAVTNFLVTSARPLPRMLAYQFAMVLPSLVLAYRLYADASRADQIVAENKIVHPAFCPPTGQALSA